MLIAKNLWEKDQMRKLTNVADCEAQIARCTHGAEAAPTIPKKAEWFRKLEFLRKLRHQLIGGRGL